MELGRINTTPSAKFRKAPNFAEVKALAAIHEMTQAFQNKDIERVMASYEPTATVVFEPNPQF